MVGCNLGDWGVWAAIDLYLGIPTPFKYIVCTVAIDLLCCVSLLWAYGVSKKIRLRGGGGAGGGGIGDSNDNEKERAISFD